MERKRRTELQRQKVMVQRSLMEHLRIRPIRRLRVMTFRLNLFRLSVSHFESVFCWKVSSYVDLKSTEGYNISSIGSECQS